MEKHISDSLKIERASHSDVLSLAKLHAACLGSSGSHSSKNDISACQMKMRTALRDNNTPVFKALSINNLETDQPIHDIDCGLEIVGFINISLPQPDDKIMRIDGIHGLVCHLPVKQELLKYAISYGAQRYNVDVIKCAPEDEMEKAFFQNYGLFMPDGPTSISMTLPRGDFNRTIQNIQDLIPQPKPTN